MPTTKHLPPPILAEGLQSLGEDAWIEVIQKMDEVYNDLLQYEVALEEKNAALEESQQFVFSVLASMSDILVVCDRDGKIEVVNQALVAFSGKPESALIGMPLFDLFADDGARANAERMFANHGMKGLADCELPLKGADGAAVPVSLNCTPRFNHQGTQVGMVITGRPVGELRRAYQALREAHEDLKRTQQQLLHSEKMASLGRLVAGVAHELNNPISFVLGNAHALHRYAQRLEQYLAAFHAGRPQEELEVLRRELRIDRLLEDLPPLIEGTVEGAERTRDIVDSLKRFSAVDRNETQPFNLSQVIEQAVHWVTKAAADKLKVTTELPEGINVLGSAGQMQQVVMNLVQNACDATAEETQPRLDISARRVGDSVEISFRDNGPGIPADNLPHLFEPFFTTKPVGKGTGLGLAITYGIVERHGGSLSAGNAPEGGAVFNLRLPLAKH
ncbi:MAG: PAS domain-containing protein [Betaproteobacteria bacterium]|nr:PAS domain-containing protein [Betaproteobacteria bacterium]